MDPRSDNITAGRNGDRGNLTQPEPSGKEMIVVFFFQLPTQNNSLSLGCVCEGGVYDETTICLSRAPCPRSYTHIILINANRTFGKTEALNLTATEIPASFYAQMLRA